MKKFEIGGKQIIVYEDGSIKIPLNNEHFCLDKEDIEQLFKKIKQTSVAESAKIPNDNS